MDFVISKPFKFKNIRSICYFNSLLQCLLTFPQLLSLIKHEVHTDLGQEFKLLLLQIIHINKCQKGSDCQIDIMIQDSSSRIQKYLVKSFNKHRKLSIRSNRLNYYSRQEDSQEAFIHLIDALLLDPGFKDLHNFFEIVEKTEVICQDCNYCPIENIQTNYHLCIYDFNNWKNVTEKLEDYKCDKCSGKNCISERTIIQAGSILPIYIVPSYIKSVVGGSTRNSTCLYPQYIQLLDNTYKLVAQIQHMGNRNGGHYIACCIRGNNCYAIDDTRIKRLPSTEQEPFVPNRDNSCFIFYQQITNNQIIKNNNMYSNLNPKLPKYVNDRYMV